MARRVHRWLMALPLLALAGRPARSFTDERPSLRQQIVDHIQHATRSIDIVVYEVGSNEIADALIEAHQRGLKMRVIVDDWRVSSASKPQRLMSDEGIEIRWVRGQSSELMHDKFVIFDGAQALTPSYNRSKQELKKAGDDAFSDDPALLKTLQEEFEKLWRKAQEEQSQEETSSVGQ